MGVRFFTVVAITFDGLKYVNVRLDLVRQLFPKFGRSTLLSLCHPLVILQKIDAESLFHVQQNAEH